jgi:hypothetical protein
MRDKDAAGPLRRGIIPISVVIFKVHLLHGKKATGGDNLGAITRIVKMLSGVLGRGTRHVEHGLSP